jgi:hypothetical protein
MNRIILPQPTVQLLEKFTALNLGDLRLQRTFSERTKGFQRVEFEIRNFKLRMAASSVCGFSEFNGGKTAPMQFNQEIRPRNKKGIVLGNRLFVGLRVNGQ